MTTEWTKSKRRGVLVDSNQNGEGKTIASVYSVRPKAGAPVSTPLRWKEVVPGLDIRRFTLVTVPPRLRRSAADPLLPVLTERADVAGALERLARRSG